MRTIEVDERTADVLEARARQRDMSLADLVADLAFTPEALPPDLQTMRDSGAGPWSAQAIAEDARLLAEFDGTREGASWDDVKDWMRSWGDAEEQALPKPRLT